jgi:hypothetical protein
MDAVALLPGSIRPNKVQNGVKKAQLKTCEVDFDDIWVGVSLKLDIAHHRSPAVTQL